MQAALYPLDTFVPGTLTLVPPSPPWHPNPGPGTLTLPWFSGALLSLAVITDPESWQKYVQNVFRNSGYFFFFIFHYTFPAVKFVVWYCLVSKVPLVRISYCESKCKNLCPVVLSGQPF